MSAPPVVALEIGTTKAVALVGELREDGQIMITGMGEQPSAGVRKSEVVDLENAAVSVRSALSGAEESGQVEIREVHLAVSGGHIESAVNRGTVPLPGNDREISQEDIDQVMEVARAVNLSPEREVLHTICQHFLIDDEQKVVWPEGMEGARLSLDMLMLHGGRSRLRNTVKVAESVPIRVSDVVFSGLCSALAVLTPEQKQSGVIVIDLGGGTTDYIAYSGGVLAAAGTLGVGGDHVTNDVALAFTIPIAQAEDLKKASGSAIIRATNPLQKVPLPPQVGFPGRAVRLKDLYAVINARAEETLTMIKTRFDEGMLHRIGAGVVLTGGGAKLDGMTDLAQKVFGMPCSIGQARHVSGLAVAASGPEYAVCSGLVQYAFRPGNRGRKHSSALGSWLRNILGG